MKSIMNPPAGKTPLYYVILRPKALLPKQIALMHDVALLMIEQNQIGYETPATQDMLLYIVTGIFFLFTFDTFVKLGKRLH